MRVACYLRLCGGRDVTRCLGLRKRLPGGGHEGRVPLHLFFKRASAFKVRRRRRVRLEVWLVRMWFVFLSHSSFRFSHGRKKACPFRSYSNESGSFFIHSNQRFHVFQLLAVLSLVFSEFSTPFPTNVEKLKTGEEKNERGEGRVWITSSILGDERGFESCLLAFQRL